MNHDTSITESVMFETHKQPVISHRVFRRRVYRSLAVGLGVIIVSLTIGMLGYHLLEGMSWIDSYMEAAMILSGMGPSAKISTTAGKIFAGTYALFSGLALIVTIGIMFAPLLHRFFHQFHIDVDDKKRQT